MESAEESGGTKGQWVGWRVLWGEAEPLPPVLMEDLNLLQGRA